MVINLFLLHTFTKPQEGTVVGFQNFAWVLQEDEDEDGDSRITELELNETEEEIEAYLTMLMDNTDWEGVGTSNNGTILIMVDAEDDGDMETEDHCVTEIIEMDDNDTISDQDLSFEE